MTRGEFKNKSGGGGARISVGEDQRERIKLGKNGEEDRKEKYTKGNQKERVIRTGE